MKCYICTQPITGSQWVQDHHPDKAGTPSWTEKVHEDCHRQYHRGAGDFKRWGALSTGAGRNGYKHTLVHCPDFHLRGGRERSKTAIRDTRGRFTRRTQ